MKILALCYKKGVGKDTLGKFILTNLRVAAPGKRIQVVSFADKLKDICYQLFNWADLQPGYYYETHRKDKEKILPKIGKSPREIWIGVGNKMREFYPNTWLNYALKGIVADIVIITDCGFTNEAKAVKTAGGMLCKINRDGLEQGTDGRETELDSWSDWDYIVTNDGDFGELNEVAIKLSYILLGVRR